MAAWFKLAIGSASIVALSLLGHQERDVLKQLLAHLWKEEIGRHEQAAQAFQAIEEHFRTFAQQLRSADTTTQSVLDAVELVYETAGKIAAEAEDAAALRQGEGLHAERALQDRIVRMTEEVHELHQRTMHAMEAIPSMRASLSSLGDLSLALDMEDNAASMVESVVSPAVEDVTHTEGDDMTRTTDSYILVSDASVAMIFDAGPRCFLEQTMLPLPGGAWRHVSSLDVGDPVMSSSGRMLRVARKIVHAASEERPADLVELTAGPATMVFSADHRVLAEIGRAVFARDIDEGDQVLISGGEPMIVTRVLQYQAPVDLYEIGFEPDDEPVEAFLYPVTQVLSLGRPSEAAAGGQSRGRSRRSGMNRRLARRAAAADDRLSIPDTDDSFR